jgi:predicted ATPase
MISGKFDPLEADLKATALAYEEFAEAFTEYIDMVAGKGETEVHLLKGAIMEKIDYTELQVLHEIIPSLGRIVDVQQLPSSEKPTLILKGADAEDRLIQIFIRLVRTVCTLGVPIILFLDDLQWADPCCLHLLTSLLLSEDAAEWQLMLICSCRTSEVSVDHPFSSMLRDVEDQGVILTEIKVSHLTKDDVTDLIHFTFPMEQSELRSLSNIVFQQTDGNLLFVIQLLKSMHEEKVLNLSNSGWWTWDKENVLVTSDIVSMARLFERKVSSLGENVQEVLRTASCLGSTFSTAALSFVGVVAVDDVVEILHKLEQVGLIALQNKSNARFVHHKVYEFVYHLSPGSELKQMHLDIGRKLRKAIPTDLFDDHLILVAQQISLGVDLIDDPAEKRAVAELFFRAGQKAALSAAFTTASAYLSLGISLLDGHWQDHYTLSLAMYNCAAEVEYYNGNMQRVDALVGTVLMNANTFEDTLPSQFTRIYSLGSREMLAQGLEENLNVLRKLGENFQRKPHIFHILHELIQCKRFLRAKTDDDILNLPKMRHNKKHAMRFMILAALFATYVSSSHVPLIAFRAIKYTMRYGMSEMGKETVTKLDRPRLFGRSTHWCFRKACVGFGMLSAIFGKLNKAHKRLI